MTVTCATCQRITRHRQASQMMYSNRHGFSGCALQPHYVYFSRLRERDCKDFVLKGNHE